MNRITLSVFDFALVRPSRYDYFLIMLSTDQSFYHLIEETYQRVVLVASADKIGRFVT